MCGTLTGLVSLLNFQSFILPIFQAKSITFTKQLYFPQIHTQKPNGSTILDQKHV